MKLPSELLLSQWRDMFFENIEPSFLSDEIVDYCDDWFADWLGVYLDDDKRPSCSEIIQFAWKINEKLAEMEAFALSR